MKYNYNKILFINGNNITYNTIGKDFYVISYAENNKIFYKKVIYNKDKKFMDSIVTEIVKSFKIIK